MERHAWFERSTFVNELMSCGQWATFLQLAVCEREQRLLAIQERFDGLRQARLAFAVGDYEAAIRTGVVCRRTRVIGSGADAQGNRGIHINTAFVESLNSMEKRAPIEPGQDQENVRGLVRSPRNPLPLPRL